MKTVVLFSGGLDSTTLVYLARAMGDDVALLSVLYGQRHRKELSFAAALANDLRLQHEVLDFPSLRPLLRSSQTSADVPVPDGHYTDPVMRATVIPSRNLIMLSIAIGWAQTLHLDRVAYAAHGGDHAIYPDCRPGFVDAVRAVAAVSDYRPVSVWAPFLHLTKADIVRGGAELGVPFERTWSCYKGLDVHCGTCATCVERREAFTLAGVPDPTVYA